MNLKMNKPDTTIIDQAWPIEELEEVNRCPYCESTERTLAHKDVQDWSFYCAPGKWNYWNCTDCSALYLNPRPKEEFIHKAYSNYYTHDSGKTSLIQKFKERLLNECYSHWLNTSIQPRVGVNKKLGFILNILKRLVVVPFDLEQLVKLPKGQLLDVGCGNGKTLVIAKMLGWEVTGIELDPKAVAYTRGLGLNIIQGDYSILREIDKKFDCVICNHVLEHVYRPRELLSSLNKALRSNGTLLLSLPNSGSHMREKFHKFWRGIEAPRHIVILNVFNFKKSILDFDFEYIETKSSFYSTLASSTLIEKKEINFLKKIILFVIKTIRLEKNEYKSDFINIIAKK